MRKSSIKHQILTSAKKHRSKSGRVQVSLVAEDVFGNQRSSRRKAVARILDEEGIPRLVKPRQTKPAETTEEPQTIDLSQPQPEHETVEEPEDLRVELYLAARAKQGCLKAFLLLRTLV